MPEMGDKNVESHAAFGCWSVKTNTQMSGSAFESYFPLVFDLLTPALLVVGWAELGVAAAGVGSGVGGAVEVVADGVSAAGGAVVESAGVAVVVGVPVAGVVEPSAAGVVPGNSGFLNGSSQVCRT